MLLRENMALPFQKRKSPSQFEKGNHTAIHEAFVSGG
jgi:hypothetical protein